MTHRVAADLAFVMHAVDQFDKTRDLKDFLQSEDNSLVDFETNTTIMSESFHRGVLCRETDNPQNARSGVRIAIGFRDGSNRRKRIHHGLQDHCFSVR
jgi:hypothetical protein